jgi:hypothetical protein
MSFSDFMTITNSLTLELASALDVRMKVKWRNTLCTILPTWWYPINMARAASGQNPKRKLEGERSVIVTTRNPIANPTYLFVLLGI